MELTLTETQAEELRTLLDGALSELGYEITATDNAHYRADLRARREALEQVQEQLGARSAGNEPEP